MTSSAVRIAPGADTSHLWEHYRSSADLDARDRLLQQYLSLVHFVARPIATRLVAVDYEELVSAGNVGLLKAVEGYDACRGLAFSTYAVPRIRGAILDELRRRDWMPRSGRARSRRLLAARAGLESRLQRAPSAMEVARELGLELEVYWRWRDELDPAARAHGATGRSHDTHASAGLGGDGATEADELPDQRLISEEKWAGLRAAIEVLPERERRVLALCYFEELTMREVGVALGVTESRVCQIRQRALRRLREGLPADGLN
ncbi:MAG: FliA/WhiG family RNA polymerase sigma factor [Gemmatimonadales bacterium]